MAPDLGSQRPRPPRRQSANPQPGDSGTQRNPREPQRSASSRRTRSLRVARRSSQETQRHRSGRNKTTTSRLREKTRENARQKAAERNAISFGGVDITVRMLGIVMVVVLLVIMLVPSTLNWWNQEQRYQAILAEVEAAKTRNAEMERQLRLWDDPEYIASQARARLGYVKPGQTQYVVVDPGEEYLNKESTEPAQFEGPTRPWMQILAISVKEADLADLHANAYSDGSSDEDGAQSSSEPETTQSSGE